MFPRLLSPATPFGAVAGVKIDERRRIVEDRAEEAGLVEAAGQIKFSKCNAQSKVDQTSSMGDH